MKVTNTPVDRLQEVAPAQRAEGKARTRDAQRGDQVEITSAADKLNSAVREQVQIGESEAAASPERIAELRGQVQSGNFPLDTMALAREILAKEG